MTYLYTIDSDRNFIHVRFVERTQLKEILECIKKVVFDINFTPECKLLIEVDADYIPTAAEIKQICVLMMDLEAEFKNKLALVAPTDVLNQMAHLAQYYITQNTDIAMEIFEDLGSAYTWLNVNEYG